MFNIDPKALNELYQINRLKRTEDVNGDIVISTIQKLFAVLTGQAIPDESDEDRLDEFSLKDNEKAMKEIIRLTARFTENGKLFWIILRERSFLA